MLQNFLSRYIEKFKLIHFSSYYLTFAMVVMFGLIAFLDIRNGAPPYGISEDEVPPIVSNDPYVSWQRPPGPAKVALQVGHWKNNEFPDELEQLRGNTGASAGGYDEWQTNLLVAESAAKILREENILVEILPATVPPEYWADIFIAIHADGSTNTSVSGYKVAAPWRDLTKRADRLVYHLDTQYQLGTQLPEDPNITRNMRGYYAFSWWRFEHAVHPMTTAAILETGFLTNPSDRKMLTQHTEIPARALANGILQYLQEQKLI